MLEISASATSGPFFSSIESNDVVLRNRRRLYDDFPRMLNSTSGAMTPLVLRVSEPKKST